MSTLLLVRVSFALSYVSAQHEDGRVQRGVHSRRQMALRRLPTLQVWCCITCLSGGRGRTRTCNQRPPLAALYPIELVYPSFARLFTAAGIRYIILQSNFTSLPVSCSRPFVPRTGLMLPSRLRRVLSLMGFLSPRMRQASVIDPFHSSGISGHVFRRLIVTFLFQIPRCTPSCRSSSSRLSCGTDGSLSPCRFQSTCRGLPAVRRRASCGQGSERSSFYQRQNAFLFEGFVKK